MLSALSLSSLILTTLAGVGIGAVFALVLVYPIAYRMIDSAGLNYGVEGLAAVAAHAVAASFCAIGATLAVWWRFRFRQGVGRVAGMTGLFLLLGGAASVAPTMVLAERTGYSTDVGVVIVEVAIVVSCCCVGVMAGRWLLSRASGLRTRS